MDIFLCNVSDSKIDFSNCYKLSSLSSICKHIILYIIGQLYDVNIAIGSIEWYKMTLLDVKISVDDFAVVIYFGLQNSLYIIFSILQNISFQSFKSIGLKLKLFNESQKEKVRFNFQQATLEQSIKGDSIESRLKLQKPLKIVEEMVQNLTKKIFKALQFLVLYSTINCNHVAFVLHNKDNFGSGWSIHSDLFGLVVEGKQRHILNVNANSVRVTVFNGSGKESATTEKLAMQLTTKLELNINLSRADLNEIDHCDVCVQSTEIRVYPQMEEILMALKKTEGEKQSKSPSGGLLWKALMPKTFTVRVEDMKVSCESDFGMGDGIDFNFDLFELKGRKRGAEKNTFDVVLRLDAPHFESHLPLATILMRLSIVTSCFRNNDQETVENSENEELKLNVSAKIQDFKFTSLLVRNALEVAAKELKIDGSLTELHVDIDKFRAHFRDEQILKMDGIDLTYLKTGDHSDLAVKVSHNSFLNLKRNLQRELAKYLDNVESLQNTREYRLAKEENGTSEDTKFYFRVAVDGSFKFQLDHDLSEGEILTNFLYVSKTDEWRLGVEKCDVIKSNEFTAIVRDLLWAKGAIQWAKVKYRDMDIVVNYYKSFLDFDVSVYFPR